MYLYYIHQYSICMPILQVKYAASDAAIALDILKALLHVKMGHEKSVHQLSHPHSESDLESSLGTPSITKSNEPKVEQILPSGNPDPRTRKESTFEKSGKLDNLQEISDSLLGSEANSALVTLCQGVVDVVYKQPRNTRGSGLQVGALALALATGSSTSKNHLLVCSQVVCSSPRGSCIRAVFGRLPSMITVVSWHQMALCFQ